MRACLLLSLPLLLGLSAPEPSLAVSLRVATDAAMLPTMARLAAEIRVRTEGRVTLSLSPASPRSEGPQTLEQVLRGVLDAAIVPSSALHRKLPEARRFPQPLRFSSVHELETLRAELEQPYRRALKKAGLESFGWIEQDFLPLGTGGKGGSNLRGGQDAWQCGFSTLVLAADRFAALQPGDRTLLLGILLRASAQLDRQRRQANLQSWTVPALPANPELQSSRQGPHWQSGGG